MARRSLDKILRTILGVLCLVMLISLGAQAFNLTATMHESTAALQLKQKIAPSKSEDIAAADLSQYEKLSEAAMFFPPPSKDIPPPQFTGLMGEYAVLNGKCVAKGDDVDGWKVEDISLEKVIVTHESQRQELTLFNGPKELVIDGRKDKKDVGMDQQAHGQRNGGSGGRGSGGNRSHSSENPAPEQAKANTPEPSGKDKAAEKAAEKAQKKEEKAAAQENKSGPMKMTDFEGKSPEEIAKIIKERTGRDVSVDVIRSRMEKMKQK